ncbi:MAG: NAD(P)-dependent oxidoreductase [Ectothiorhodospiraceae bacterium]|nr:NAD(P)-dependent oxidoreductase [Ectothiorhodospiraceae bacterium]
MTTLVTGGPGFVGLNLIEQLLARGDTVVSAGIDAIPAAAHVVLDPLPGRLVEARADVRDAAAVTGLVAEHGVRRIVHGAVITAGPERERRDAAGIVAVNVGGTVNVLDAAVRHGIERLVFLSSASVYGASATATPRLAEDDPPPRPESLYAVTKHAAECTALRYRTLHGIEVVAARLTAVFGRWEHDTGLRDTLSAPYRLVGMAEAGAEAVLPDEGPRDWIYGPDVARGILALLDAPALTHPVYNVGPGTAFPLDAWCARLAERFPAFRYRMAEPGETGDPRLAAGRRSPLAIDRLRAETGFTPRFDLESALDDYLAWRRTTRL